MKELKIGLILSATDKMSRILDNAVSKSTARMRMFGMEVNRSNGLFTRMSNSLGGAIQSLPGSRFFTNPIVAITAAGATITKLGIANEQAAVSFEVLLGSQQKAVKLMDEIRKYADTTPFEKQDLYDASKTMLGFGISQEKVISSMKMLGDVSMGNRDRFQSLALAFSQITAAGKLQGQDLLQLINAGYNPLKDISEMTGVSMGKLKDAMSKGQISSKMVEKALKHATEEGGKFHDMTQKIGQTVGGKISTAIDSFKNRMLQLYEVISPLLIPVLDLVIKAIDSLAVPLGFVVNSIVKFINLIKSGNPIIIGITASIAAMAVAANAASIAFAAWTAVVKIATVAQMLFNGVLSISPLGWIMIAIAGVTAAVVACWNEFDGFRAVVKTVWEVLKRFGAAIWTYVTSRIKELIDSIGSLGEAISLLFQGEFEKAGQAAKTAIIKLSGVESKINFMKESVAIVKQVPSIYNERYANESSVTVPQQISNENKSISKNQSVVYSPQITINGGTTKDKEEFSKLLKEHSYDLENIMNSIEKNKLRLSY